MILPRKMTSRSLCSRSRGAAISSLIRVFVVAVLVTAWSGATAWADGSDEAYREAYERGTELFDQGKWAEAREQFQKAYGIQPKPLLLFNIGSTYRREGNYIEALFYYHRYLEEAPADAEYRSFAEKVIVDLNAKVEAAKAAAKAASTQGQKGDEQKSDTQNSEPRNGDGQTSNGQKAGQASLASDPGDDADQPGSGRKYAGLAIMAVGVIGLGWGGYEAWQADSIAQDLGSLPMGTPWTPELQSEYERGQAADTRAKIALAAGGAAVVIGGVLYLTGRSGSSQRGESRGLALGPQLGPQSIGVIVHASF